jgi:type IV secretory pathway VirB10-like protein
MRSLLILLVPLLAAAPALAETCKYVDSEGRIIYSNVPVKRARKVTCFQAPAPPPEPSSARPAVPPTSATNTERPRVEPGTQRRRDQDRRTILEDELAREQKALDDARKTLAQQETLRAGDERNYSRVQERLQPFQEAVATHEKNIASIQRELATSK